MSRRRKSVYYRPPGRGSRVPTSPVAARGRRADAGSSAIGIAGDRRATSADTADTDRTTTTRRGLITAALLLIVPMMVSAVVAYMAASRMEPLYAAQSDVVFDVSGRGDVLEKFLATQSVIVRSRATLAEISDSYGIPVETLEKNLSVDFPKGSGVMRLQYADANADIAYDVITALVGGYMDLLGRMAFADAARQVLVPPFIVAEPVWPKPLQAAAVGAAVGLALAIAALALVRPMRVEP